uniref:Secreted protein n=1 Tax=Populus trichocarpa TaxID=3694 RepID=A0A3N7GVN6_POPTR
MQVLSYILLAIMLFFGAFGPGARTCYAVRYVNKMEHSRTGLRAFQKRTIPAPWVSPPTLNVRHGHLVPPSGPSRRRPPPPGTIY